MSEGSLQPERRSTGVTAKAFFKGKSHQVLSQTADTGQGQSHTSTMGPPPPAKLATAKASPPPSKAAQGQDVAGSSTEAPVSATPAAAAAAAGQQEEQPPRPPPKPKAKAPPWHLLFPGEGYDAAGQAEARQPPTESENTAATLTQQEQFVNALQALQASGSELPEEMFYNEPAQTVPETPQPTSVTEQAPPSVTQQAPEQAAAAPVSRQRPRQGRSPSAHGRGSASRDDGGDWWEEGDGWGWNWQQRFSTGQPESQSQGWTSWQDSNQSWSAGSATQQDWWSNWQGHNHVRVRIGLRVAGAGMTRRTITISLRVRVMPHQSQGGVGARPLMQLEGVLAHRPRACTTGL